MPNPPPPMLANAKMMIPGIPLIHLECWVDWPGQDWSPWSWVRSQPHHSWQCVPRSGSCVRSWLLSDLTKYRYQSANDRNITNAQCIGHHHNIISIIFGVIHRRFRTDVYVHLCQSHDVFCFLFCIILMSLLGIWYGTMTDANFMTATAKIRLNKSVEVRRIQKRKEKTHPTAHINVKCKYLTKSAIFIFFLLLQSIITEKVALSLSMTSHAGGP